MPCSETFMSSARICDLSIYPWMSVPAAGKNPPSSVVLDINDNFNVSKISLFRKMLL